ncbi:kinase-like domain-containing protein [Fomitopsis serialis]|uniref:kinase-like domain-containing protein n=1 Tax=Fomitopsis serialis TaxID=139415 RepID=UPI0020084DB5|nr:kinase-like domain-containing protein [Neoantrodia serialis]KAH9931972.1 kinase-like domain-containing protein [Neoantrodia serialis]
MDRILHGQSVIGKTSKTTQVDVLRFTDKDLDVVGTLEYGQYGVIDVVTCRLDGRVYVRKSTEKRFALKTHDASQCSPQFERDILLQARKTRTEWAPYLLCAFQTPTHLNLVMDYAEGGTLWDVLESSPYDGKISEPDLRWWAPQIVSAIHWCHSQGFVHRDIKPHNFVLKPTAHLLLIDFGSAAPLLATQSDGSQRVAKHNCLVPVGTCDYISPEILQVHEEVLVALEMSDAQTSLNSYGEGYGRETDWWSMGAMLYEMAYGVAPFFAKDIRKTYMKITDHHRSLRFPSSSVITLDFQDFVRRLLTDAELRLGRAAIDEIQQHPFFAGVDWLHLHEKTQPDDLHTPQFTYTTPVAPVEVTNMSSPQDPSQSRHFAFSALFQSSPLSNAGVSLHPSSTPSHAQTPSRSILRDQFSTTFIGFSWGPPKDVFDVPAQGFSPSEPASADVNTPRPLHRLGVPPTPFGPPSAVQSTPMASNHYPFATPIRPSMLTPFGTLPRASTIRRTAPRRTVSDREALKQLVDCVGQSARKKVLESGRKPRVVGSLPRSRTASAAGGSALKELRFDTSVAVVGAAGAVSYKPDAGPSQSQSTADDTFGTSLLSRSGSGSASIASQELLIPDVSLSDVDSDIPPSPSPSPRPGSALSMLSKRSQTPTATSFYLPLLRVGGSRSHEDSKPALSPLDKPPRTDTAAHASNATSYAASTSLSYDMLDDFDRRFTLLMRDIAGIEHRLGQVSSRAKR